MTKDEWLLVKNRLSHPWGAVTLMVDGYTLMLRVEQVKALKFSIAPYVNGEFKGIWLRGDCEEAKRFLRPVQIPVFTPSVKARLKKGLSKTAIKRVFGNRLDETLTAFHWGWPTFGPLQRHLIAHNKVIELVGDKPLG